MANKIKTLGMAGGAIETEHQSGQSVHEWVSDHTDAVGGAAVEDKNDELRTTWTSASGQEETITTRMEDESDKALKARHINEYIVDMVTAPPLP